MDRITKCRCSRTEPDIMDDAATSGYFLQCPTCGWLGTVEHTEADAIDAWNAEMEDGRG